MWPGGGEVKKFPGDSGMQPCCTDANLQADLLISGLLNLCVVYVCVYVLSGCVHVEARGQCQVSSSIALHLS